MAVYLDLVILLNFLVDLLLLLGTNRLTGFPPGLKRAVPAALLGALYAGACMIPEVSFLGSTLWRAVFLGLMGCAAFGCNRGALKRTGIFVLLSMAMGGIAMGYGRSDFMMLLLSGMAVWCLCRVGFGKNVGGREYVPVAVTEGERSVTVIALRDTGNTLRDPITGEQVLVLSPEAARKLTGFTQEQLGRPLETMLANPKQGLRLIPYSAVGQPGSMLLAKRFQNVKVGDRRGSAIVAFAPERIGVGDVYQALTGGAF